MVYSSTQEEIDHLLAMKKAKVHVIAMLEREVFGIEQRIRDIRTNQRPST